MTIQNCFECPFGHYHENGEYLNAGVHCQNGKLYDNIEKNGFKGMDKEDTSFIPDATDDASINEDVYIHPNCPLPDNI